MNNKELQEIFKEDFRASLKNNQWPIQVLKCWFETQARRFHGLDFHWKEQAMIEIMREEKVTFNV